MTSETLAPDIAWEPSGHLSEIALSALADGEEALLDAAMHGHLSSCEACGMRLGEVALRSSEVAGALSHLAAPSAPLATMEPRTAADPVVVAVPAPVIPVGRGASGSSAPRAPRRKVPVAAIGAALAVAMLGAAPSMMSLPAEVEQTAGVLRKVLPSFVRLLPRALDRLWGGPTGPGVMLMWGLSLALVAAGFGIARKASKKAMADGGRR